MNSTKCPSSYDIVVASMRVHVIITMFLSKYLMIKRLFLQILSHCILYSYSSLAHISEINK